MPVHIQGINPAITRIRDRIRVLPPHKKQLTDMKYTCLLLLILLVTGCRTSHQETQHDYTYRWAITSDTSGWSSRVQKSLTILSEEGADELSGTITDITSYRGQLFILDTHTAQNLLVYDSTGRFVTAIGRRGNGPGEFVDLEDVSIFNDTVYLLDSGKDQILRYRTDGHFIDSRECPIKNANAISATAFGFLLHDGLYEGEDPEDRYAIYFLDRDLRITDQVLPYRDDSPFISTNAPFIETDSTVMFHQLLWDSFQQFNRYTGQWTSYGLDFGSSAVPDEKKRRPDEVFGPDSPYRFLLCTPVEIDGCFFGKINRKGNAVSFCLDPVSGEITDLSGLLPERPAYLSQINDHTLLTWLDLAREEARAELQELSEKPEIDEAYGLLMLSMQR